MEVKFIEPLILLGIPGVSIGIFYLLMKKFDFSFSKINALWSGIIAIIFLLIVAVVTIYALNSYNEHSKSIGYLETNKGAYTAKSPFVYNFKEEEIFFDEKLISIVYDVIVVHAHSHIPGVAAEYSWLKYKYPGYKVNRQVVGTIKGIKDKNRELIYFDVLDITLASGREKKVYFDISNFYTPGRGESLGLKPDVSKIKELYKN